MVITDVATNIDTKGYYQEVNDLVTLRQWLYSNDHTKLYILDEANEHLAGRRAMSGKNVGFIQLIPEISKAHAKLLIIGHQLLTIDKTLINEVWCRGAFIKLGLKKAYLISSLLPQPYTFDNIPKTSISFDPYVLAPFQESPTGKLLFKNKDLELMYEWANGKTYKDLGIHPQELHRLVVKYVKMFLETTIHPAHS
jgi:hypothetical protein